MQNAVLSRDNESVAFHLLEFKSPVIAREEEDGNHNSAATGGLWFFILIVRYHVFVRGVWDAVCV